MPWKSAISMLLSAGSTAGTGLTFLEAPSVPVILGHLGKLMLESPWRHWPACIKTGYEKCRLGMHWSPDRGRAAAVWSHRRRANGQMLPQLGDIETGLMLSARPASPPRYARCTRSLHAISSFSDRTFASAELRLCCQILNESDAEGLCLGAFPYPFLPCNIQQSKGYQHDGSGTH